nr:hypothetical protein [Tanacetum cinerariifolium]
NGGVVSVFPNQKKQLHTTRSWDFMGFPQDVKRAPFESDVIVGMLDTGVWPEADNFKDDGFGPPPSRWKGSCDSKNFTCNKRKEMRNYQQETLKDCIRYVLRMPVQMLISWPLLMMQLQMESISLSVGGSDPVNYFDDLIAIGAFHAMKNNILTSNSAGNDGPFPGSITSLSP